MKSLNFLYRMNKEATYWITLAHDLPMWSFSNKEGWKIEDKNNLIIKFFHENKITPQKLSAKLKNLDFIETGKKGQTNLYKLKGQKVIQQAKLF
jgi:hypothetical protein